MIWGYTDRSFAVDHLIDLERYPLDRPETPAWQDLVERAKSDLATNGMFNLEGFLRPGVADRLARELHPELGTNAFDHRRQHNVYFRKSIDGVDPTHPALKLLETVSHTICADQMGSNDLLSIYEYPPLIRFLAASMGKPMLHAMADPLARLNVMAYRAGEALNWHFDRSEFTTTLLLQAPAAGGAFEYRTDLRSERDPNYDGVARLLRDEDPQKKILTLTAGTLNVFRGKNTAHRVTPVQGDRERIVSVFSYYERPDVMFTAEERLGFYGRAA